MNHRQWITFAWTVFMSFALPVFMAAPVVAWGGAPWSSALAWSMAWAAVTAFTSTVVIYCTLLLVRAGDALAARRKRVQHADGSPRSTCGLAVEQAD